MRPSSLLSRLRQVPRVRGRQQAGFSLIEVMCAVLILGISVAGLTFGISTALSSSKDSERQTAAALLAAGQIEILRAEHFLVEGALEGEGGAELPLYRWKQTVTRTDIEGLYEVAVAVEHTQTGQLIYELTTLLFDPPIATESNQQQPANERDRGRDSNSMRRL